jgi:hypothetical protein
MSHLKPVLPSHTPHPHNKVSWGCCLRLGAGVSDKQNLDLFNDLITMGKGGSAKQEHRLITVSILINF